MDDKIRAIVDQAIQDWSKNELEKRVNLAVRAAFARRPAPLREDQIDAILDKAQAAGLDRAALYAILLEVGTDETT